MLSSVPLSCCVGSWSANPGAIISPFPPPPSLNQRSQRLGSSFFFRDSFAHVPSLQISYAAASINDFFQMGIPLGVVSQIVAVRLSCVPVFSPRSQLKTALWGC